MTLDNYETRLVKGNKVATVFRDIDEEDSFIGDLQAYGLDTGGRIEKKSSYFRFDEAHALPNDTLWAGFMGNAIPILEADGWSVDIADDFDMQLHEVDQWHAGDIPL